EVLVSEGRGAVLVVMATTMRLARPPNQGIPSPPCAVRRAAHCLHDTGEVPRARRVPPDAPRPDPTGGRRPDRRTASARPGIATGRGRPARRGVGRLLQRARARRRLPALRADARGAG